MIALGRLLMAVLFLIGVSLELGNPAEAPPATAILAVAYLFFAGAILVATWNSWWADARLAGAAHTLDIAMFTLMVLLTQGYTSPFFTFFMFLLLSAAIRWGWKATALTAVLVTLLYLIVGLIDVKATADFNLAAVPGPHRPPCHLVADPDLVRDQPVALALLARRAGAARQPVPRLFPGRGQPARRDRRGARIARRVRLARAGQRHQERGHPARGRACACAARPGSPVADAAMESSFLYDLDKDRALCREPERGLRTFEARTRDRRRLRRVRWD